MKYTNGKQVFDLTDSAHIDCFRAKGWTIVDEIIDESADKAQKITVSDVQIKKTSKK